MPLIPPPVLVLGAAVTQRVLAGPSPAPTRGRAALTLVIASASVALAGAASRTFVRLGTTFEPTHPDKATVLVTTGSNALTRNPMYVGMTGLLVAHATWHASWRAVVPVACFVAVIDRVQIEAEESALLATFGADYEAYRAATPRWLDARSLRAHRNPPR